MTPTRKSNASPIDIEAQGDAEERRLDAAREILERISDLGPESLEARAYDQLKALIGEGALLNALGGMLRHVRTAESLLAADKDRKSENATAIRQLRSIKSLLEQRQKRAIADSRVNAFIDATFPLGFIRELPDAIAYFEGDNERKPARQVIGLGKQSGGGINPRSKLSIRHASVGRCVEEIQHSTGENVDEAVVKICNKSVGILAATLFGLKAATAYNVAKWRQQWVDGRGYLDPGDNDTLE